MSGITLTKFTFTYFVYQAVNYNLEFEEDVQQHSGKCRKARQASEIQTLHY